MPIQSPTGCEVGTAPWSTTFQVKPPGSEASAVNTIREFQ